ncbi:hypothetical protein [Martelella sp. HB161492]|uniref:hypothetical protein n=1 Tax=Martelella sp. HB161492 TaxID=2720726 RepID=UPI001591BA8C|nr:hypothetical protein [Martelella sp. HB161492]
MRLERRLAKATFALAATCLLLLGLAGCTETSGSVPSTSSYKPPPVKKELPDSIVAKWEVFPVVGTSTRGCSMTFIASAFDPHKGRVSLFYCHRIEGLGGIRGLSRVFNWKRRGTTIILLDIMGKNIGSIEMPVNAFPTRAFGFVEDDINFVMTRKS